jgi:hypothetical protein
VLHAAERAETGQSAGTRWRPAAMRYRPGMPAPGSSPSPAQAPAACLNCGEPLTDRSPRPAARFCPACGQETTVLPPTVREFAQQFGGAYLSTEGALWRTLKLLLTQPGELTRLYLAGRRKHYVLPLRLYLTISLLALLLIRYTGQLDLVTGLDRPELAIAEQGSLPKLVVQARGMRFGVDGGAMVCENLPETACRLLRARAAPDARTLLHKLRLANERVLANLGTIPFVLLPLFAVCLRIVNRHAGMGYAEHLVFALHLHAFWFGVLAVMQIVNWTPVNWAGGAVMLLYTLLAGRRVYGGVWWQRALRAIVLSALYATLLAFTVVLAWLLALLA